MPNLYILSPPKWPWRAFSPHMRINLDFKGDPVEFENWPDFPVMFPYVLLKSFKITLVSHEPPISNKLYWYWVFNEQPTRRLVQSWTKWISLGGSSIVSTHSLGPLLSISLCWASVYMTRISAARTQRAPFFLCFSDPVASTLQLWSYCKRVL